MANKVFYAKPISDNLEICLVCGWVGENRCVVFTRDMQTKEKVEDFGIHSTKDAHDFYSRTKPLKEIK
jgi:hypothetical protein